MRRIVSFGRYGIVLTAVLGLSACAATYRNHGYVPSEEQLDEIVVGVDTRDSVAETVGSPSSAGLLDDSGYYYVRSRMQEGGIRGAHEIERQVVAITFDGRGVVSNIERFGLEDGKVVSIERRVTQGSQSGGALLRQLLANFGRFVLPE